MSVATPKAQASEAKIDKWNYIKLKCFCIAKKTLKRIKRQPIEWEKIFANHISDNGLISIIQKERLQPKKHKRKQSSIKWTCGVGLPGWLSCKESA